MTGQQKITLVIDQQGQTFRRLLHDQDANLEHPINYISRPTAVRRCSFVEPFSQISLAGQQFWQRQNNNCDDFDNGGAVRWLVDLTPVAGPVFGPFSSRADALYFEESWLIDHDLPMPA